MNFIASVCVRSCVWVHWISTVTHEATKSNGFENVKRVVKFQTLHHHCQVNISVLFYRLCSVLAERTLNFVLLSELTLLRTNHFHSICTRKTTAAKQNHRKCQKWNEFETKYRWYTSKRSTVAAARNHSQLISLNAINFNKANQIRFFGRAFFGRIRQIKRKYSIHRNLDTWKYIDDAFIHSINVSVAIVCSLCSHHHHHHHRRFQAKRLEIVFMHTIIFYKDQISVCLFFSFVIIVFCVWSLFNWSGCERSNRRGFGMRG